MAKPILGLWWEPNHPSRRFPGVLYEEQAVDGQEWLLKLDGIEDSEWRAQRRTAPPNKPVLLGTTGEGKAISLFDSQFCTVTPPILDLRRGSATLSPRLIASGLHIEEHGCPLRNLRTRVEGLDAWVSKSGFTFEFGPQGFPWAVKYEKPRNVEVRLNDGVRLGIGLWAEGSNHASTTEARITQTAWLTAAGESALPFDKLLRYIRQLANLVELAAGRSLRSLEIVGEVDDENSHSVTIEYNRKQLSPPGNELHRWEMLFTLSDVESRFDDLVNRWIDRSDAFESLYRLYFGTIQSPFMYVEQRLINMFQALESYHRRKSAPSPDAVKKHESRVDSIIKKCQDAGLEKDDRDFIKARIKRPNEMSAKDRIKDLVTSSKASWLLSDDEVRLAADYRNYHTHFSPDVERRLPARETQPAKMLNLGVKLRILCELVLLDAMGFSMEDIREKMKQTQRMERHLVPEAEGS